MANIAPAGAAADAPLVNLFGGPYLTRAGEDLGVPQGSKRLLAFVALRRGRVERAHAAGALWPYVDDDRAAGNLRSSLWRLRKAGIDVLVADKWSLYLAEGTLVDVDLLGEWAGRLVGDRAEPEDLRLDHLPADALDLLPGWYDDWAIIERERMRQRLLHAMEALSRRLTSLGRYAEAVDAATTVVAAEPLRESAQRVLIEAQLAQGNVASAQQTYRSFATLVRDELGLEPSRRLAALLAAELSSGARGTGTRPFAASR